MKYAELDLASFLKPVTRYEARRFVSATPGVRGAFLKGPLFRGKGTRVFIWYGLPEKADAGRRVPGIVLIHGGLGTAYAPWVKKWVDHGFAAVAVDQFCAIPKTDGSYGNMKPPRRHRFSGPVAEERFDHLDEPLTDQWGYHSIAAVMLANTFLRDLPEVDENKVGVTGISWGGYAAAVAAGVDPRYAFAMVVYGCGGCDTLALSDGKAKAKREKFCRLWDPNRFLPDAKMPILWTVGTNDFAFDVANWNHSSKLAQNSFRALRTDFPHGQYEGEDPAELFSFARAVVDGKPYTRFDDATLKVKNLILSCRVLPAGNIDRCEVVATRATGRWNDRFFRASEAQYDPGTGIVKGKLPSDWTAAYLAAYDDRNLLHTSEVAIRKNAGRCRSPRRQK
ncbi:MAG: prolyl oligopeptidase family serine peptidase [Victivallaceae bacterium]|nr:prolyl oligopeptidase family serine peptidase [Victivallaceae bacterium]